MAYDSWWIARTSNPTVLSPWMGGADCFGEVPALSTGNGWAALGTHYVLGLSYPTSNSVGMIGALASDSSDSAQSVAPTLTRQCKLQAPVAIAGVGARVLAQRQGTGRDEHCVVGRDRVPVLRGRRYGPVRACGARR